MLLRKVITWVILNHIIVLSLTRSNRDLATGTSVVGFKGENGKIANLDWTVEVTMKYFVCGTIYKPAS